MKKWIFRLTAIGMFCLFFVPVSKAEFISKDDSVYGAGRITMDTDTGYEWLDITVTAGLSQTYVSSQFGSGGVYEWFRYATTEEAVALYAKSFYNMSSTLIGLLGATRYQEGYPEVIAATATSGAVGALINLDSDPPSYRMGETHLWYSLHTDLDYLGHWLVREASPESIPSDPDSRWVSVDDPVFGAGAVTLDTETGLEWLDPALLVGLSRSDLVSLLDAGGDYEGFRYASFSEAVELCYTGPLFESIYLIAELFGANGSQDGYPEMYALTGSGDTVGLDFHWSSGEAAYYRGLLGGGGSNKGHWLLRETGYYATPLPGAIWLLGSGLLGLAGLRKRRAKRSRRL